MRARGSRLTRATLEDREDALREVCFCLLYDLCAWLARARHPVPSEVPEYRLTAIRQLPDPRERLRRYLDPELLEHWDGALLPFFETGASLSLELGEAAPLQVAGLEADGEVRAELRFSELSSVLDRSGRRHPLPKRDWTLEVWLSQDLSRVEDACLRLS